MNNNIKQITERINKIEEIEQYIEFLKNSLEEINKNINNVNESFDYSQEKEIYEQDLNVYSEELKTLKENFDIEEAKKYIKLSNAYNNWSFNYQRIQTLINKNGISQLKTDLRKRYNQYYKLIKDNKEEYERLSAKYGIQPINNVIEEKVETVERQEKVNESTNQQPSVNENSSIKTDYDLNTYQGRFDYLNFLITEYEKLNGDKNDKMYRDSKEFVEILPKWNENINKINSIVISSKNAEKVVNPWDYEEMKSMPSIKGISGNKRIDKNLIVDYITIYVNLSEMLGRFNTLNGNFQNGQFIKSLESRINELKKIKTEAKTVIDNNMNDQKDKTEYSQEKSEQIEQSNTNSEIDNKIKELKSKIRELQDSCKGLRPAKIQMFVDHTNGQKYNIPRDKVILFRQYFSELKKLEKLKSAQNVKLEEQIIEKSFTKTPNINPGKESSEEQKVESAQSVSFDSIDEYIDQQLKSNNAVELIQILLNVGNKFGYENAYKYFNAKFLSCNDQLMELNKQISQNSDEYQKLVSNMLYHNIVEYSSKKKGIEDKSRNLNDQYKMISKKKKMYGLIAEHFKKLLPYANDLEKIKEQFLVDDYYKIENQPVEEPIVEEPIVEEPIVEKPIVEEPIVEEPIVEEPIVEEPNIDDEIAFETPKEESNDEAVATPEEKTENKTEQKKGIIKKAIQKIFNIFKKRKPKDRESLRKQLNDNIYSIVGSITFISTITPHLNNPLNRSIISDLNGYMIEQDQLKKPEKIEYDKTAKIDSASDYVGKGNKYDPNFSWEEHFAQQESGKQR